MGPSDCSAAFSSYMLYLPTADPCFKYTATFFGAIDAGKGIGPQGDTSDGECQPSPGCTLHLQSLQLASTSHFIAGEKSGSFHLRLPDACCSQRGARICLERDDLQRETLFPGEHSWEADAKVFQSLLSSTRVKTHWQLSLSPCGHVRG